MSARSALADHKTSKAGRPLTWAAGLSLLLVAVVAFVALTRDARHDVDTRPVDVARASPAEAAAALADFVADVSDADASGPTGIGRNAELLDLTGVTARYVDQVGTLAEDGSWSGLAEMTWQLAGFDDAPSRAEVVVDFAPDGDGLAITGFGGSDGAGRVPLWLRGELSVVRTDDTLVVVDGGRAEAEAVARRVARGRDVVRRVLPDWRGPVVVEVPASAADLDETLGAAPGTYAGVAAVTAAAGSPGERDVPIHVFVNPEVTDGLRRAGAQVVMSHELVHVATDAARTPMEPWLLEGFADYVALRDTQLPDRTTLGRAIQAARRVGVPDALPTAADFDTRAEDLQARYEEAWLACRIIAQRVGEQGLVAVYDAAKRGEPTPRALKRAGLAERELVAVWHDQLEGLTG